MLLEPVTLKVGITIVGLEPHQNGSPTRVEDVCFSHIGKWFASLGLDDYLIGMHLVV